MPAPIALIPAVIRRELNNSPGDLARWVREAGALIGRPSLRARITVGAQGGSSRTYRCQIVNQDGVECQGLYALLLYISDTATGGPRRESTGGAHPVPLLTRLTPLGLPGRRCGSFAGR